MSERLGGPSWSASLRTRERSAARTGARRGNCGSSCAPPRSGGCGATQAHAGPPRRVPGGPGPARASSTCSAACDALLEWEVAEAAGRLAAAGPPSAGERRAHPVPST
jgi:hypothetical protein